MKLPKAAGALVALVVVLLGLALPPAQPAVAGPGSAARWVWPLRPVPRVVRYFEPPSSPYGPGHRGVDLAGWSGEALFSIGAGSVVFAGSVAGRGVVVVDHGALRSTYQPVYPAVKAGDPVRAGSQLGWLELAHSHCLPRPCLHLGVLSGHTYLDPLTLLGPRPIRLLPLGGLRGPERPLLPMGWDSGRPRRPGRNPLGIEGAPLAVEGTPARSVWWPPCIRLSGLVLPWQWGD